MINFRKGFDVHSVKKYKGIEIFFVTKNIDVIKNNKYNTIIVWWFIEFDKEIYGNFLSTDSEKNVKKLINLNSKQAKEFINKNLKL